MNDKKCVYLITNNLNGKKYVGVAEDFKKRMYQHKIGHDAEHSYIDKAVLKYGWENFTCEIIDNYETLEERKELERRYIELYQTQRQNGGYDLTDGGEDLFGTLNLKGSNNPRAQLMEDDVKQIRIRRMNGERLDDVYEDYKDRLDGDKRAGFSKIWLHESWIDICPEFRGNYPKVDPKHFATKRRNILSSDDLDYLDKYFRWNGPLPRYNILFKTFKEKVDWESFQEICKEIVSKLYGPKDTRKYKKKTGKLEQEISKYREELQNEPIYHL